VRFFFHGKSAENEDHINQSRGEYMKEKISKANQPTRFVRMSELTRIVGLSVSQLYKMQKAGKFPHSIKLTSHAVAWDEQVVREWMEAKIH
jgi:prophage regulatory protein